MSCGKYGMVGLGYTALTGKGLFDSVFPEKKEEPEGGLFANAMLHSYLSENGPIPKTPEESAVMPEMPVESRDSND